jgi:hypothetical protein
MSVVSAYAGPSTGGVTWLDPLSYQKPAFLPIALPTIATNYYVDLSAGSNSSTCGTSTTNPCLTIRGLSGSSGRSLSGLRGNSSDGAAAINVRGTGSGAFFIYNETFAGTPGKEILIRPWGTGVVTFRRGATNQGLNGTPSTVHDIIIDGGDPNTGAMLFKFVADNTGSTAWAMAIAGDRITFARSQFTATATSGNPRLAAVCNNDGMTCNGIQFINNEFYDCNGSAGEQCSSAYPGSCGASGSCAVNNFVFKNNVVRNIGGDGLEINPRITSTGYTIEGNAFHHIGFNTCSGNWECRPGITLGINQSGSVNQVVIQNNLIWDTASGCIWEKTAATGTSAPKIYNNTCYDYGKGATANPNPQGFSAAGYSSKAYVQNNIIVSPSGVNPYGSGVAFQASSNNICASGESCGTNARTWSSSTMMSTSQDSANFARIATTSEAADAGVLLSSVTIDYTGGLRVGLDIGAFAASIGPISSVPSAPTNLHLVP